MRNVVRLTMAAVTMVAFVVLIACGGTATTGQPSASASIPDFRTTPEPVVPTSTEILDFRTTPEPGADVLKREKDYLDDLMRDDQSFSRILKRVRALEAEESPSDRAEGLRTEFGKVTALYDDWRRRPAPSERLRLLRKLWLRSLSEWSKAGGHYIDWLLTGDEQESALSTAAVKKAVRAAKALSAEFYRRLDILLADSSP